MKYSVRIMCIRSGVNVAYFLLFYSDKCVGTSQVGVETIFKASLIFRFVLHSTVRIVFVYILEFLIKDVKWFYS
jgi:hypothetical protein